MDALHGGDDPQLAEARDVLGGDVLGNWQAADLQAWWGWVQEADPAGAGNKAALLFGLLGALMDVLMMRTMMRKQMRGMLKGLGDFARSAPASQSAPSPAVAGAR